MEPMAPTRRDALIGLSLAIFTPVLSAAMPGEAAAQVTLPAAFAKSLLRSKLVMDTSRLADFAIARVLPNPHFEYDFAIRHNTARFEVRYAVRDLTSIEKDIEKSKREVGRNPMNVVVPFENLLPDMAELPIMNMSVQSREGPRMGTPRMFAPEAVSREFGANTGFSCRFSPRSTFANFPDGIVTVIYRHDVRTMVHMIYLYEAEPQGGMPEAVQKIWRDIYYVLRFQ